MSILAQYEAAFESGDKEQLDAIIHDDCKFYPHVGGAVMTKGDIMAFAGMGAVRSESHRILFENDEVGVGHSIAHFANGSTPRPCWRFTGSRTARSFTLRPAPHRSATTTNSSASEATAMQARRFCRSHGISSIELAQAGRPATTRPLHTP